MSERRENLKQEIKEVAERIELKLSDYRTRYYKEIPVASRKKIYNSLENVICEVDRLCFVKEMEEYMYFSEIVESRRKNNTENVYSHLNNVVNETLKYYNEEFSTVICNFIDKLQSKLKKSGYYVGNDFEYLKGILSFDKAFKVVTDKYPDLLELKDCMSIITNIDAVTSSFKKAAIHELYGIKALVLELEEKILMIDTIEDKDCMNVILEYFNYRINLDWFKEL